MDLTIDEKRKLIDPAHSQLTIQRQCELLELNQASNIKRIRRLLRQIGLEAIDLKPNLSKMR